MFIFLVGKGIVQWEENQVFHLAGNGQWVFPEQKQGSRGKQASQQPDPEDAGKPVG